MVFLDCRDWFEVFFQKSAKSDPIHVSLVRFFRVVVDEDGAKLGGGPAAHINYVNDALDSIMLDK